jgi:methyltransferase
MFTALLALLILQRIVELLLAERNRRWAMALGGKEWDRGFYPVIVVIHTLFYLSLLLEWHYRSPGWNALWPLWLALLLAAQVLRLWSIQALGRHWNTRIIVIPGTMPVRRGPYRFIRHPNYAAVIIEILTVPILCGAYWTAIIFCPANALLLARRIPREEQALARVCSRTVPMPPRFLPRLFRRRSPRA